MTLCQESKHDTGKVITECRSLPAFRARCLRLAPQDPRWAYLSGSVPYRGSKPTHRCGLLGNADAIGIALGVAAKRAQWRAAGAPGPCGLGRRAVAASAHRGHRPSRLLGFRPKPGPKSPPPHLRRRPLVVPALERPRARALDRDEAARIYAFSPK